MDVDEADASAHAAHICTASEYMGRRFVVKDRVYEVVHDAEAAMLPLHVQARLPHRLRAISTIGTEAADVTAYLARRMNSNNFSNSMRG